jgi:CheY-like chemotaxis protein/two-component sensor histidine kinase
MELSVVDPAALARETLTDISHVIEQKNIDLQVDINPDLPQIEADPIRIRQVITNLLSNAAKFTDDGQIALRLSPIHVQHGTSPNIDLPLNLEVNSGMWLVIQVEDSGIGISEEDQQVIFDAFRQADGTAMRQYEGTGLGLAIVRQMVEMHGGHIWVESELDRGSTFTIILPTLQTSNLAATADKEIYETDTGHEEQQMVLIVDDDPAALQLMQDYLSGNNYRVVCTNSPQRAIHLAQMHQPAVLLADLEMPKMHGFDLLRVLKASPLTNEIPVVIFSVMDARLEAEQLGAAHYLTKPISQSELLSVVQRLTR